MFYLGPYRYKSKDELKAKIKKFLKSAQPGKINHPVIIEKLNYLLLMHPGADRKIGAGLTGFKVERNLRGAGQSFVAVRNDGTEERFSYKACIDGTEVSLKSKAIEAFRFCIREQMIEFRESISLPVKCLLSGKLITKNKDLHIDHKIPFSELVNEFCRINRLSLSCVKTKNNGENLKLASNELEIAFYKFHKKQAILQPSLKQENHAKSNKAT